MEIDPASTSKCFSPCPAFLAQVGTPWDPVFVHVCVRDLSSINSSLASCCSSEFCGHRVDAGWL